MAQLSNDCFAFGGPLLSLDHAIILIEERLSPVTSLEQLELAEADGRILAEDLVSTIALPPFDNSAVDGWAVASVDLNTNGETILPVRGRIAAGDSARGMVARGCAVRVFTGAPVPDGADVIFMQEDVRQDQDRVALPPGLARGANLRLAGEDIAPGALVMSAGQRLRPQDLALASAIGRERLPVRSQLRVALVSTGNEIQNPGAPLVPGALYDSNRVLLGALLRRAGAAVSDLGILRDDPNMLKQQFTGAAAGHDLIISSGGVSTGEEDHVRSALAGAGKLVFWRLGIKPGRPIAMGIIEGVPFVGLPGNPVAAFVTFHFVVLPIVARLSGARYQAPPALPVSLAFRYRKKAGRREYVRVILRFDPNGSPQAHKYPKDGAGVLTSLTGSDGLVALPEDWTSVEVGDSAPFYLFRGLI